MKPSNHRSLLVKLIVFKKACFSLLLLTLSLLSSWSWRNYDGLTQWAENYVVDAEFHLVQNILNFALNSNVQSLRMIARITGIYGLLLGIATLGFWYHKVWAHLIFVTLVGLLIPIEILEILHHISSTKLIIFGFNLIIFIYLCIGLFTSVIKQNENLDFG